MEIIEVKRPIFESLDTLRGNYSSTLIRTREIVSEQNLTTPEGKFSLLFLLATANLLKSAGKGLNYNIGGPAENPHKAIDLVGGEMADIFIKEFLEENLDYAGSEMYVEERGVWEAFPKGAQPLSGKDARMILIDPFDETSSPWYGSVGISIFDKEGNFVSGGVASLEDEIVVFIEGNKSRFVGFDGSKNSFKNPFLVKPAPGASDSLKVATLQRRLENQKTWESMSKFSPKGLSLIQTFGGYALVKMLTGEIDLMFDVIKGQPWYEAAQWGALAEKLGFSVEYDGGKIPDAKHIISQPTPSRIPLVISRNKEIQARVLESLK